MLWGLSAALLVLLVLMLCLVPRRHACVVTGRLAKHARLFRLGGRCYEVQTCTGTCHEQLEAAAAADPDGFKALYNLHRRGPASLALAHPGSGQVQVVTEVPCMAAAGQPA
jgi:hypothetical protein